MPNSFLIHLAQTTSFSRKQPCVICIFSWISYIVGTFNAGINKTLCWPEWNMSGNKDVSISHVLIVTYHLVHRTWNTRAIFILKLIAKSVLNLLSKLLIFCALFGQPFLWSRYNYTLIDSTRKAIISLMIEPMMMSWTFDSKNFENSKWKSQLGCFRCKHNARWRYLSQMENVSCCITKTFPW